MWTGRITHRHHTWWYYRSNIISFLNRTLQQFDEFRIKFNAICLQSAFACICETALWFVNACMVAPESLVPSHVMLIMSNTYFMLCSISPTNITTVVGCAHTLQPPHHPYIVSGQRSHESLLLLLLLFFFSYSKCASLFWLLCHFTAQQYVDS